MLLQFPAPIAVGQSPYAGAIKFYVHQTQQPGTVKLYRLLLADGTRCYTTSNLEVTTLTQSSKYKAKVEPMDAFVYTEKVPGTTRLYRITGRHPDGGWRSFYTAFEPEMKNVRKQKHSELHRMKAYVFPHDFHYGEITLQQGKPGTGNVQDVTISAYPKLSENNLGIEHHLEIGQDGKVALLRFDLSYIPKDAKVRSAALELFSFRVGSSEEEIERRWPIDVYECRHPWVEGTGHTVVARHDGATFSTSDGKTKWPTGQVSGCAGDLLGTALHEGGQTRWCAWQLKPTVVEEWISGRRPNFGMLVWGKRPGKNVTFASSNTTTLKNRPILRLMVVPPGFDGNLGDLVPVYCCYNPVGPEHFYTTSEKERDLFVANTEQAVALKQKQDAEQAKELEQKRLAESMRRKQEEEAKERQEQERRDRVAERYRNLRGKAPSSVGLVGAPLRVGSIEWTVTSARRLGEVLKSNNQFIDDLKAGGQFIQVDIRVENQGGSPKTLTAPYVFDDKGRQYRRSTEAHWFVPDERNTFLRTLNPNVPVTCSAIYDVADDATGLSLLVGDLDLLSSAEGAIELGL
jgi:hypothetical protein